MSRPLIAENPGPVKRQTCAKMKQKGACCDYSSEIQVKWCQNATTKKDYYVYQLTSPPMCKLSYCAGSSRIKCNANCAWNEVISNCSCKTIRFLLYYSKARKDTGLHVLLS